MTLKALTAKQKSLLQAVREGDGTGGIYSLAASLNRDYRRVFDNVYELKDRGYVRISTMKKNGREVHSVTPAVTGSVLTVVNVSLPVQVNATDLLNGLTANRPLSAIEEAALTSFFADVPSSLAIRFLNEHGIPLTQAATAYKLHVMPVQKLPRTEAWLNVDPYLGPPSP